MARKARLGGEHDRLDIRVHDEPFPRALEQRRAISLIAAKARGDCENLRARRRGRSHQFFFSRSFANGLLANCFGGGALGTPPGERAWPCDGPLRGPESPRGPEPAPGA